MKTGRRTAVRYTKASHQCVLRLGVSPCLVWNITEFHSYNTAAVNIFKTSVLDI